MSGVTKTDLVSANETWPNCPRCGSKLMVEDKFNNRPDAIDLKCNNCGQDIRVGNIFIWEGGLKEAYEVGGSRDWPGWDNDN